jgi:hypothetical protein
MFFITVSWKYMANAEMKAEPGGRRCVGTGQEHVTFLCDTVDSSPPDSISQGLPLLILRRGRWLDPGSKNSVL